MIHISKDTKSTPINAGQARNILQAQTDNYGIFFDLERILEYEADYARRMFPILNQLKKVTHNADFRLTVADDLLAFLLTRGLVPKSKVTKRGKLTLDAPTRDTLMHDDSISEDARFLIGLFDEGTSCSYMVSYLRAYKNLPLCHGLTREGNRMVVANPVWNVLSTSRISAKNPSVQNINRDCCDIIASPQGMEKISADSGQIEPKINYSWKIPDKIIFDCIKHYNDAYFGILAYCYLPEEALRNWNPELYLKPITDEQKAMRQSLKTLTNAASYGSALATVEPGLKNRYESRIVNHPLRSKMLNEVQEDIRRGTETFYGFFGTAVTPESTAKHEKGDDSWAKHLENCAINNPIQTTASELMLFSVDAALGILNKYKDVHIAYYKHDESCFYVPEDKVDILLPEIEGIMSYQVEGWISIYSEAEVGRKKSKANVKRLFGKDIQ